MNELQMIRTMLTEEPPSAEAVAQGRERLRTTATGRRRLRRPVGVAFALTAVAAASVLAVGTLGSAPRAPDQLSARDILLAAASKEQTTATGNYWYAKVSTGLLRKVGPPQDRYFIRISAAIEQALGVNKPLGGMRDKGMANESWRYAATWPSGLRADPATPADWAAWRRDGSPESWQADQIPGLVDKVTPTCVDFGTGSVCGPIPRKPKDSQPSLQIGTNAVVPLGVLSGMGVAEFRIGELERLPTDPVRLRAALLPRTGKLIGTAEDRLWIVGVDLVTSAPVSAKVRAAAFRMLADMSGVRSLGTVRDPEGRKAIGVARTGSPPPESLWPGISEPPGPREYRLLIDPDTGRALASEVRLVRAEGPAAGLARGALWSYAVLQTARWVDKIPADSKLLLPGIDHP